MPIHGSFAHREPSCDRLVGSALGNETKHLLFARRELGRRFRHPGAALAFHARHRIPEEVSWATLADLGRNLAIDRRMNGEGWPVMLAWLTKETSQLYLSSSAALSSRGAKRDSFTVTGAVRNRSAG